MRRPIPVLLAVAVLAACGATDAAAPPEGGTVGGVGSLPEPLSGDLLTRIPTGTILPRNTVERPAEPLPVAERASGSRVLAIGDSILASTSQRYGGELCAALLPLGWTVELNAEVGRFVDFGERVLDRRLQPEVGTDWDVAVISLGSNFRGDVEAYRAQLHRLLDRLEPRPTVLLTVTEFRSDRAAVNDVIRDMLRYYADVQVLDWAALTRDDPSLLSGDGLHLSTAGRERIAAEVAELLGPASSNDDAECLSTSFTDDSAGSSSVSGTSLNSRRPSSAAPASPTRSPTPSTVATTSTPPTAPPTTSGGTGGGSGSGSGGGTGGGSGGGTGGGSVVTMPPLATVPPTTEAPAPSPTSPATPTAPAPTPTAPPVPAPPATDAPAPPTDQGQPAAGG